MLVQHFLPLSSPTIAVNSSSSPPPPPPSLSLVDSSTLMMKSKKTSILSPFFNSESESTGFQPTTDSHNNCMSYSEKIQTHLSTWPRKLSSIMEIHRQRFSQLNPRFKQHQQRRTAANLLKPVQTSIVCPIIIPAASRPQPRQQARSKQNHYPLAPPSRRPTTVQTANQQPPSIPNRQYITLANLTKILHVLQTQEKMNDHETSTDTSTSTTNSAKQRVQQHLQETATRWWKPVRSSDYQSAGPAPSTLTYATSATPVYSSVPYAVEHQQIFDEEPNTTLPLLTIVSNSTRQLHLPSTSGAGGLKYDESESSTEVQGATTVITSLVQPPQTASTFQQPLIMQARGMRLHSYDNRHYMNKNMNFFQRQRLIRQT